MKRYLMSGLIQRHEIDFAATGGVTWLATISTMLFAMCGLRTSLESFGSMLYVSIRLNLGERSHQGLFMREIYSRTQRTLICLYIKPSTDSKETHWTVLGYEAILMITDRSERHKFERHWTGYHYDSRRLPLLKPEHGVSLNHLFSCK